MHIKRTFAVVVALGICVAVTPTATAATTVQPTESSITAWADMASGAAMRTTAKGTGSRVECRIAASQASDCIQKTGGNPDTQVVTNAKATRQWFRTIPNGAWKSNAFAASANPVSNYARFFSYNPFAPWTAKVDAGVTWTLKKMGGRIVIDSRIATPRDDEAAHTTIRITPNGKTFTIIQRGPDGTVSSKSVGRLVPTTVQVPPAT